jgi:hypothetical protein
VIAAFEATQVKVSVNGGAFVTAANTAIPALAATLFDLLSQGGSTGHYNGRAIWSATCLGTLTDTDAAALHTILQAGDEPVISDFPSVALLSALMPMSSSSYVRITRVAEAPAITVAPAAVKTVAKSALVEASLPLSVNKHVRINPNVLIVDVGMFGTSPAARKAVRRAPTVVGGGVSVVAELRGRRVHPPATSPAGRIVHDARGDAQ